VSVHIAKWSESPNSEGAVGDVHVTYEIVVGTSMEAWVVTRRYRDFSSLHKK
jgi:hypothetical protein